MSKTLRLNRNTVDAAYHELAMQGWLSAEPPRGTFVAHRLPEAVRQVRRTAPSETVRVDVEATGRVVSLSDGLPDPRLAPTVALGQAFGRALASPTFLTPSDYGDPRGGWALQEALTQYLGDERGLATGPDRLIVTRGSQMALFLAAGAVADRGMTVAVETPGYPMAWAAFRAAGARVAGVPVDGGGIDFDALERLAAHEGNLRAVYVTPPPRSTPDHGHARRPTPATATRPRTAPPPPSHRGRLRPRAPFRGPPHPAYGRTRRRGSAGRLRRLAVEARRARRQGGLRRRAERLFGLSTQDTDHQRGAAERLHLPFPLLSDAGLDLSRALDLPLFEAGGLTLIERLTLVIVGGRIERVFHPVPSPAANASDVAAALASRRSGADPTTADRPPVAIGTGLDQPRDRL